MSDDTLEKLNEAIESVSFFKNRYWMEMGNEIESLQSQVQSLEQERERLRGALEFYAYEFQWSDESDDRGSTARAVLQEFEEDKALQTTPTDSEEG